MDVIPPIVGSACAHVRRTLLPGTECLYLKLYCSANNCDYLLREVVLPFVDEQRRESVLDHWFFIRYGAPDWHLRLRFFGEPAYLLGKVLPHFSAAAAAALAAKRLYRLEVGTYSREVERYGGIAAMPLAESLFASDSDAAVALLNMLDSTEHLQDRWRIAVAGVDRLLDDFGFDIAGKLAMMVRLSAGYEAEFQIGKPFKESLSRRFRSERWGLQSLLAAAPGIGALQARAQEVFAQRSARNRTIVAAYNAAFDHDRYRFEEAVEAMVHMHLNRLLRSAQRAQELVIYNFLQRLYRSVAAREAASAELVS